MHPAGKKAHATILTRGKTMRIAFQANDSSTLRAIFSSYLRMLAASLKVSNALIEMEASRNGSNRKELRPGAKSEPE